MLRCVSWSCELSGDHLSHHVLRVNHHHGNRLRENLRHVRTIRLHVNLRHVRMNRLRVDLH